MNQNKFKIMSSMNNSNWDTFVSRYSDELKVIRIDHFYNTDHDIAARFIETTICLEVMVEVLAALQFKFEELVDESVPMDERHITKLLERFYEVEDLTNEYQKYHSQMQLNENDWDMINKFTVKKENGTKMDVIQIDLYEARESFCGPQYKQLMDAVLPNTNEFDSDIKNSEFY